MESFDFRARKIARSMAGDESFERETFSRLWILHILKTTQDVNSGDSQKMRIILIRVVNDRLSGKMKGTIPKYSYTLN